jgi:hypothetical protein
VTGEPSRPAASPSGDSLGLSGFVRGCRQLPARFRAELETNPAKVVGSIAAGSFVLGALLASRLGRVVAVAAIGYGVNRFLDGPVGREIGDSLKSVLKPVDA